MILTLDRVEIILLGYFSRLKKIFFNIHFFFLIEWHMWNLWGLGGKKICFRPHPPKNWKLSEDFILGSSALVLRKAGLILCLRVEPC